MTSPSVSTTPWHTRLQTPELSLGIAVVVIVGLLVMPLSPWLLDLALGLSFALALMTLLVVLSLRSPLDFSAFPSALLFLTMLRLGLNVSSTRLILTTGEGGRVIEGFGSFILGGNPAVGLVIFLILVLINFLVVTKGADRIAEVSARFVLDSLPGRQMAIDSDVANGKLGPEEARDARDNLVRLSDFYSGMEGAQKFVRGDAIASFLIVLINIIAGFFVGVVQMDLSMGEAAGRFTALSVGDGLVTQIPAFLISIASGMIVTFGTKAPEGIARTFGTQISGQPRALMASGAVVAAMGLVPGLPALPFFVFGGLFFGSGAWTLFRPEEPVEEEVQMPMLRTPLLESSSDLRPPEDIDVEIGYALVGLLEPKTGEDALTRLQALRSKLGQELGFVIPKTRIRDNMKMGANDYGIMIHGSRVATGKVYPQHLLAIRLDDQPITLEGVRVVEPVLKKAAVWITPEQRITAEAQGYMVAEAESVLATHIASVMRRQADRLLSRQQAAELVEQLRKSDPALVDETVPLKVPMGVLHRVLQALLREGIPITNRRLILEALGDLGDLKDAKDIEPAVAHVRRSLGPMIVDRYVDPDGVLRLIGMGPQLNQALMALFGNAPGANSALQRLGPEGFTKLLEQVRGLLNAHLRDGDPRPLWAPTGLRATVRRLIEGAMPTVPVLEAAEIPITQAVEFVATWEMPE
jgi:flagellar biosynthesis protein FlhA